LGRRVFGLSLSETGGIKNMLKGSKGDFLVWSAILSAIMYGIVSYCTFSGSCPTSFLVSPFGPTNPYTSPYRSSPNEEAKVTPEEKASALSTRSDLDRDPSGPLP
jgi:hypothetical protein